MAVKMEKLENSRVKLTVDVDVKTLAAAMEEAYHKNRQKINIPGFRKGRAPRQIIEMNYGPDVFLQDAIDILLPRAYSEAIEETEIRVMDQPDVDIEAIDREKGAVFVYTVDVYPEIELGNYKNLEVEKEIVQVSDLDVENILKQQQERNSELVVAEHTKVQDGDFTIIDYIGYVDGKPFSGGAGENQTLEIGSGQFIPGFEEQLIDLELGGTKDIQVTFPTEYHSEELAGKEATFTVTIKELKEKVLPELDDEFAKDISECETLDELKAQIRKELEDEATRRTTQVMENTLLEQIADDSSIQIPQSMIDYQAAAHLDYFMQNMRQQGLSEEMYLEMTGQSKVELQAQFEPQAKTQIIHELILEAINEQEGIAVSEEEVDQKIQEYMGAGEELDSELEERMKEYWASQKQGIEMNILREKAMQVIIESAVITEVEQLSKPAELEEN